MSGAGRTTVARVPIAEGLFTGPDDDPRLLGSSCVECGLTVFPAQPSCPGCGGGPVEQVELPSRGTLWTWTTQSFPPVAPPYLGVTERDEFAPFGIGWVSLSEHLMIEARLTESDPERLRFGMPVELTLAPVATDDEGNDVVSFAFRPVT
jgi:uncharacterized OB-fold protein